MSTQQLAVFNECFYLITAAIAVWLDRKRAPKEQHSSTLAMQNASVATTNGVLEEV